MANDKAPSTPPLPAGLYTTIVPVHGQMPFIDQALESIRQQTATCGPILLVADPPKSRVSHHLHSLLSASDGQLRLLEAPKPGIIGAINHAITQVKTPFVSFLDSDDLWTPKKQEGQLRMLLADLTLDAVTSLGANFRGEKKPTHIGTPHPCATFTATTFRHPTFERCGLLDPDATHYTWLYRWWIHARGKGLHESILPELSLLRRVHSGNSWVIGNETGHRELLDELRRISRARADATRQGLAT